MSVAVIGLSHRTSPVTVRERFAFADTEIPAVLAGLRATGFVDEAVILSTCNRVELYAAGPREAGSLLAGPGTSFSTTTTTESAGSATASPS